ncbi:ATP-binding protein [Methanosarcina mazei]|uniref:ATP-binding protein n=1 Tax=Methanosarcina mazei TaxID=2209 RepID=UPI003C78156C
MLQLGDQLIKNEGIGLLELVKNSYDADATSVSIKMENLENPALASIVIEDNGIGMDMNIITNVWMEPGTDYKEELYRNLKRSQKFNRLPLGEKGIGRFSVHKLGNEIELITKKEGYEKEIVLKIDWNIFAKSKYFEDTPIKAYYRQPEIFTQDKTGTKIIIKNLKTAWSRGMVREVHRSINSLSSPFDSPDSFKITFDIDNKKWIEGLLSWEDIKEYSLFSFECEIEGDQIEKLNYKFTPWPLMKRLTSREITEKDEHIKKMLKIVDVDNSPINLAKYNIGKIEFKGLIFDRDSTVLSLGVKDKQGLKKYLDSNGGIRVYRDGIRIYDYGETGSDWLNLDRKRVNVPSKKISNNIILGSIELNREYSKDLIEKTNREGFVENEGYYAFVKAISYTLSKIEILRKMDKDNLRLIYGPSRVSEPVLSDIEELKALLSKKIKNESLKKESIKYLNRIKDDYNEIKESLLKSAGLGLNLSVIIHEMEKIIDELKITTNRENNSEKTIYLVKHLSEIVEGYTYLIKKSDIKREDLRRVIRQAIFNIEFRLKVHNVDVIDCYSDFKGNFNINCSRSLVAATIMNILDNSLWWLKYKGNNEKKVIIKLTDEIPQHLTIVIADNGPGFTLPTEQLTKPFITGKPDGMGIGLHIANEVMNAHGGEILFPEPEDFLIPDDFKEGAIIALSFRKEESK